MDYFPSQLHTGKLTLVLGPMFSGKTTELVLKLTNFSDVMWRNNKQIVTLLITHKIDNRGDVESSYKGVTTHNSGFKGLSDRIDTVNTDTLASVDVSKYKMVGIDEGQFFDDLELVRKWVNVDGIHVVIASLDGDSMMRPFGKVLPLIPMSCDVRKLSACCVTCSENGHIVDAYFTAKIKGTSNQKEVGGMDMYIPVCMSCHKKKNIITSVSD